MAARPSQLWVTVLLGTFLLVCRSRGVLSTVAMGQLCPELCFYPWDLLPPIHIPMQRHILGMTAVGLLVAVLPLQHS